MKTTKEDFQLFKTECQRWIDKLELSNYDIVFKHADRENFEGAYNQGWANYQAILGLSKTTTFLDGSDYDKDEEIKNSAKHECIHLLLKRYVINANARYIGENELNEAEEEIVRKLCKIL